MRRAALALLFLAVALLLAGCGKGEKVQAVPETVVGTLPTPTTTETTTLKGDATAGKAVYAKAGCGGCHTLKDAGSSGTIGPSLDEKKPAASLVADRVTNGKGVMPAFKGQLTEQEIADVAAYVSSVAGK